MRHFRRSSRQPACSPAAMLVALALAPVTNVQAQDLAAEPTVGCSADVQHCFEVGSTIEAWGQSHEVLPRGGRLLHFTEDAEGNETVEERWIPFPGRRGGARGEPDRSTVRVAVREGGGHVLVVTGGDGILVWADGQRAFRSLVRSSRDALAERPRLAWAATLIAFSDDGPVAYLHPLEMEPIAIDLERRRIIQPSARQRAERERKIRVEARIRLMAEDPWLKVIGLQWALALGDFQHVDLAARYLETETNLRVRMLSRELLAAYREASIAP